MKRCQNNFFAGATTGDGFVNFYDQIVDRTNCNAYLIIKGGSGMGKSTLLKKIADTFDNVDVELFNCSSDTNSLDGVSLANGKVGVVDGTSPHAIEPTYLGINDRIVDMSICLGSSIESSRPQLTHLISLKKQHYDLAYRYLKLAKQSFSTAYHFVLDNIDVSKIYKLCVQLLPTNSTYIYPRRLFSQAFTSLGKTSLTATFGKKLYKLHGSEYAKCCTLSTLAQLFDNSNISYCTYYHPLSTHYICAIETYDFCITTNPNWSSPDCEEITLTDSLSCDKQDFVSSLDLSQHRLIEYATRQLNSAMAIHQQIEQLYRPHINFEMVDKITHQTLQKIETYLQK